MHVETYPAFLTPRDEEPSLSSSEEKSSEFGWLERKRKWKMKEKEKQSKALYILYIYISIYWSILHTSPYFTMDAREYIEKFFQPS